MTAIRREIHRLTAATAPVSCPVTLTSVREASEGFLRVVVSGGGLADYRDPLPADAFKILLPPDGAGTVDFPQRGEDGLPYWPEGARQPALRAFTVRHFDPVGSRIEFDVFRHPGLAMSWLCSAQAGDVVGLGGMRRDFAAGTGVDEHLIAGDASALPAIAAIVESLAPTVPATVYLAAEHESDMSLLPRRAHVTVHRVGGGGSPAGRGSPLERAVRQHGERRGRVQAWLAAEAAVVREMRRVVLGELGVSRDDLQAAAYWRAGSDSTRVDAVNLQRYQREVDAGGDVTDPDVRERIDLHP